MTTLETINFVLNGQHVAASVMPHDTLVEMLQKHFHLRGARESCGQGLCGCCTVFLDSQPVSGCLTLARLADGTEVTTVEGLAKDGVLDPVQQAFIEAGAFQCGFCTPGFIMMVKKLLSENPDPSDDEIRHYLNGNLCRCSAYPEIMDAVKLAAYRQREAAVRG